MAKSSPFLSICIPTFNHADTLFRNLEQITSDEYFVSSGDVEVVVSDNCSTDHTEAVVRYFESRFPGLVRYFKTEANVADENFHRVLKAGRGKYLKLLNDSFSVRPGVLKPWTTILKQLDQTRPVVFLINEVPKEHEPSIIQCDGIDDFLSVASYRCTWIGGFGVWREDLDVMPDFARAAKTQLLQVDALLRMLEHKSQSVIIREFIFDCKVARRKSGYNIAEVFGANYLGLLKPYVQSGALSQDVYDQEKKKVLLEHILPFVATPDHDFEIDALEIHLRDYSSEEYFLPALQVLMRDLSARQGSMLGTAPMPLANATAETYEQQWRRRNAHNETEPGIPIGLDKVSIGRKTYGRINAWHWGHEDEALRIGHFCSIGGGVEFLLGGNHSMDGVSTFPFKVKYFGATREALSKGPIVVGDDVWIGNRAMIHSGVTVGQGAVVAAGAVVARDVPPYAVVAGNPARVVKYRFPQEVVDELLELDYSKLTDAAIRTYGDRLVAPLRTALEARELVGLLMGAGANHPSHCNEGLHVHSPKSDTHEFAAGEDSVAEVSR